jgi:HAE1 family hydrophobic/amphiphilic exporter-1
VGTTIMVALYDSYVYPFVVLLSIPIAMIGALPALVLVPVVYSYVDGLKERLPALFKRVALLPKFRSNGKPVEVPAEL